MAKNYLATCTSFREISEDDRPREKAERHGIESLTDAELLAILFNTGTQGRSVIEMAKEILKANDGHLNRLANMTMQQIIKAYKGVGKAKALTVLAGLELGKRAARDAANSPQESILSSAAAYELMRKEMEDLDHEEFRVVYLNNAAVEICREIIGIGGQSATAVDIKIIARKALENKATRVLLYHNHPSGTLRPSIQDDSLTGKIRRGLELLDIHVDDHIIISKRGYYSYNDEGRLNR